MDNTKTRLQNLDEEKYMEIIKEELLKHKDIKYKEFQVKLIPNISLDTIIGIRTDDLRNIAKGIFMSDYRDLFLSEIPHEYFEENLLHMFIISSFKDFDTCIKYIDAFLPYVDSWPVSDQASPKVFKKNHEKLLPYIKKWISSNHVYTIRFGIRMLMNEFLGEDFKEEYLELVSKINGDDYYLKMMIAWYFATALSKQYDATISYIENHKLDDWVHKKTIQKAIESFRVKDENKEYLKSLR